MFQLREEHLAAFRADALIDHLRRHHPDAIAGLDETTLRARVVEAVGRADRHGLTTPRALAFFVTTAFVVGRRFDEEPAIRDALVRADLPPDRRVAQLLRVVTEADWARARDRSGPDAGPGTITLAGA
jgi:hypothetical protein